MNTNSAIRQISRRQFLKYCGLISASAAGPIFFTGCAVDPVTGKKQLMMVSAQQEIGIDKQQAPFQFSSDYGITQDTDINRYVSDVGKKLLPNVHRPQMPYNFQCVNATYINAYAFPGGSIAVTRGILLKLDNEAELASLLGHELGHVNARHAAEQMSKGQLSSLLVGGISIVASTQGSGLGDLTQQLGALGQGLLLSKYSRDNEREADSLGNEYMVKAGFSSKGFVGLMEMLNSLHKENPGSVQVLFSTHPMSSERLTAAVQREKGVYAYSKEQPLNRDRYMDSIASLRMKKQGIELLQEGEKHMGKKEYDKAEVVFKKSLNILKNDYTAHMLMSKCLMTREKPEQALSYADRAKKIYPAEPQGFYIAGIANSELKKYDTAYQNFSKCDELLPGNPQMTFFKGFCLDKKGDKDPAANNYITYLKMINYQPNKYSKYAYDRLKEWGYAK
ncbi:MAG: M48 family metalloprotease [Proteobacteria bacterium]|nr:M48 family metalloprotease [Pseudomonadota bacterium]MBU1584108.1 M48 family metalloprotease [Pseudomonadota bacterium]MBU2453948.1 M48 family metalloprotease [Pseudomonadota bacterium]MBU2629688.1 M48 family metalloprotease [Pseudomonadota bacterium]